MASFEKPLVWLQGEIKTPPFSSAARIEAGYNRIWRVIYRTDTDAVVIAEVFEKKTRKTPKSAIDRSRLRLRMYDNESS
jgi:hypothetical protein